MAIKYLYLGAWGCQTVRRKMHQYREEWGVSGEGNLFPLFSLSLRNRLQLAEGQRHLPEEAKEEHTNRTPNHGKPCDG